MTTRPGTSLQRAAARLLPTGTMERFVNPAVADLQHEHATALRERHSWRARRVRAFGTLRLLQVIALLAVECGLQRVGHRLSHPARSTVVMTEDAMGAVGVFTSVMAIGMTIALGMMAGRHSSYPGAEAQIAAFSVLSVFDAGALFFGFTLALLLTSGRVPARRVKVAGLMAMCVLFSGASVSIISATVPSRQAASRVAIVQRRPTDARTASTLTSGTIDRPRAGAAGAHSAPPLPFIVADNERSMLFANGARIAAGISPLMFCLFALTLARRVRIAVAFPAAASVWVAYLAWFTGFRQPLVASSLPVQLALWMPDAAIVSLTVLLAFAYTAPGDRRPAEAGHYE